MDLPTQDHLYIYNRFKERQSPNPKTIPFYFFGSSSNGNSVYLKDFHSIIDLGFPYKQYQAIDPNFFLYVDYVFLTHQHTDHLNPATLMKILKMYPHVKIMVTHEMITAVTSPDFNRTSAKNKTLIQTTYRNHFLNADVAQDLQTREGLTFHYQPHHTEHGPIGNVAVELLCPTKQLDFMYASDLDTLYHGTHSNAEGLPDDFNKHFNLLLLEANYDKNKIDETIARAKADYYQAEQIGDEDGMHRAYTAAFRAKENLRHISEQASWQYVQKHLTNDGWFVPLHASSTYGTLIQNLD